MTPQLVGVFERFSVDDHYPLWCSANRSEQCMSCKERDFQMSGWGVKASPDSSSKPRSACLIPPARGFPFALLNPEHTPGHSGAGLPHVMLMRSGARIERGPIPLKHRHGREAVYHGAKAYRMTDAQPERESRAGQVPGVRKLSNLVLFQGIPGTEISVSGFLCPLLSISCPLSSGLSA